MSKEELKLNKLQKAQKTIFLLTFLAILSAISYFSFITNPEIISNKTLYVVYIIVEFYVIMHSIFVWWTILHHKEPIENNISNKKTKIEFIKLIKDYTVDVFVPVVSEPFEIVERTITAVKNMNHIHKTYILDDKGRADLRELAKKLEVNYIHRTSNEYFKAGNVNNAIKQTKSDFIVVFDSDFVPRTDFLLKLLPYFADENLALLQTPQYYRKGKTFVEEAALPIQNVFYELIMPGKNAFNAAFCVGTNVIYRRKALEEMGGLARVNHSEDVFTSLKLHENKWKTLYVPEVMAVGLAPDTVESYFKQQRRWSRGGFAMLLEHFPLLNKKLSIDQRIQYMSCTFYLSGFAILAYVLFPMIYLLTGERPVAVYNPTDWLIRYIPFFLINFSITLYAMGGLKLKSMALSIATCPVYIGSFLEILIGKKFVWQATNGVKSKTESFSAIYSHILICILGIFSIIVGAIKPVDTTYTLLCIFWVSLYTALFGTIVFEFFKDKNLHLLRIIRIKRNLPKKPKVFINLDSK